MPKILRILNRLNIGGPTYNVAYLSKYINAFYETKVLAGIKEPYEGSSAYLLDDLNIDYEYVPHMFRSIQPARDFLALREIRATIKNYKPDIVHTHAAKAGLLGRSAAYYNTNRPKAIVHTYHGNVFDGYFSPLKTRIILAAERHLSTLSNAIVAISPQQKNDLVNKYRIAPDNKVHVIRLGFDLQKFAEDVDKKRFSFRRHYGLTDDTTAITITGRLTSIKNHALLIESLKLLRASHPDLQFKVFIVGDGELYAPLLLQIKEAGFSFCEPGNNEFSADVIFTSWRKDIDVINAGSDIIALTSLNEGTPVSIIEGMASQRAVICTDVGGVKDVVEDGHNGFLCDVDAESYARRLEELIVNKPLRVDMAK